MSDVLDLPVHARSGGPTTLGGALADEIRPHAEPDDTALRSALDALLAA